MFILGHPDSRQNMRLKKHWYRLVAWILCILWTACGLEMLFRGPMAYLEKLLHLLQIDQRILYPYHMLIDMPISKDIIFRVSTRIYYLEAANLIEIYSKSALSPYCDYKLLVGFLSLRFGDFVLSPRTSLPFTKLTCNQRYRILLNINRYSFLS